MDPQILQRNADKKANHTSSLPGEMTQIKKPQMTQIITDKYEKLIRSKVEARSVRSTGCYAKTGAIGIESVGGVRDAPYFAG